MLVGRLGVVAQLDAVPRTQPLGVKKRGGCGAGTPSGGYPLWFKGAPLRHSGVGREGGREGGRGMADPESELSRSICM